ncbi:hypothetical protein JOB18_024900 [Solea senegalensis]|uniref:Uncharacterized protein n=1 Tax=Solea senegalensis TaxID=28829 RepID=A0AAV6QBG7_SOLSE|nr:hypothetical protein JOB18_024900 [Solea senegalensis]
MVDVITIPSHEIQKGGSKFKAGLLTTTKTNVALSSRRTTEGTADTGRGKARLQTDAQTFPQRKDPKTDTFQDGAAKDTPWKQKTEKLQSWRSDTNLLSDSSSLLLGCGEEDTCFLRTGSFDLFASASASSIYKGHERE